MLRFMRNFVHLLKSRKTTLAQFASLDKNTKWFSGQKPLVQTVILGAGGLSAYLLLRSDLFFGRVEAKTSNRASFNFIADVVEKCAPAVVYIEIKDTRRIDFFSGRPVTSSNGSGFIIKENGLIITNAHVVLQKPNSRVEVKLYDGSTFTGIVEDVDTYSDLATVRIKANNLPTMQLGSSKDLRPGEFVVAIGSPLALSNSVTSGVVSSTQRASHELGLNKNMVYIQTDAAITFGNSGGPLVNMDGEAIGVNSMRVTAGISFAIPIDYVKEFLASSKGVNKTTQLMGRRYMGITMLTLTPDIIMEFQRKTDMMPPNISRGVLVWKVIVGSPAHNGGLQPGDIVTHINGKEIVEAQDVHNILADLKQRTLKMTVVRYGREMQFVVTPEES